MLAGGQVLAADLPAPPVAAPPRAPALYSPVIAPAYNWGGVYLGINGGGAFGSSTWTGSAGGSTGSFTATGGVVGGTLGFNYQIAQFVIGAEGDIDFQFLNDNSAGGCGTIGAGLGIAIPTATTCKTKSDWLGTIRGRAGYAADRFLIFATGGAAFGDVEAAFSTSSTFSASTQFGWTVGGGLEYGFTDNFTARIEYLYVDLGKSASCTAACNFTNGAGAVITPNIGVSLSENLVRVGLNYKFGAF